MVGPIFNFFFLKCSFGRQFVRSNDRSFVRTIVQTNKRSSKRTNGRPNEHLKKKEIENQTNHSRDIGF